MRIEFVNHASFILFFENIALITDPWLDGTAFHDGWALVAPTVFPYERFSEITHIWFSHEHPDHFSPGNLKKIKIEDRAKITVLFQKTKDGKVADFCRKLGFKEVLELYPDWTGISDGFSVLNVPHNDGDSWLCVKTDHGTILNINDCGLESDRELKEIKNKIGPGPIDILFTQFSYANWSGNPSENLVRRRHAQSKLTEIKRQVNILKPHYTVPFASFIWFCHEENYYMNDEVNKIRDVRDYMESNTETNPIILYPGDKWRPADAHPNEESIEKWEEAISKSVRREKCIASKSITDTELIRAGKSFIDQLTQNNGPLLKFFLKPTNIFITDHNQSYQLSLKGIYKVAKDRNTCDISISSNAMEYCFKFNWGGATTRINGRYEIPPAGSFRKWKMYFQVSELNNHGHSFGVPYLLKESSQKALAKLKAA